MQRHVRTNYFVKKRQQLSISEKKKENKVINILITTFQNASKKGDDFSKKRQAKTIWGQEWFFG